MHLFHDNTWRLITEKLPEKPKGFKDGYYVSPERDREMDKYYDAITALKQNALTVGNPEILKQFNYLALSINGDFVRWPGGYEERETPENRDGLTVAILTLPEEKTLNTKNMKTAKEIIFDNSKEVTITMHNAEMCMRVYVINVLRELKARLADKITSDIHEVECVIIEELIKEV